MLNSIAGLLAGGVAATSFDSIATTTVGAGGTGTVTFSSIPSTYAHLQLRVFSQDNRATYGITNIKLQYNSDTGSNYTYHELYGNGTSATSAATTPYSYVQISNMGTTTGGTFGAAIVDILDYASTNKYKTTRILGGGDTNGAVGGFYGSVEITSGLWLNTAAINTITLTPANGTLFSQYSKFALYGIKGA